MKITKTRFVYRFNKWIHLKKKHIGGAMLDMSDPVYGLINLYAHKPGAIEDLKNCRVNPDFNSSVRNDLEFYIPQLCSIYMVGHIEEVKNLVDLILASSKSSIFFSHRIWFFLQSLIFDTLDPEAPKHSDRA